MKLGNTDPSTDIPFFRLDLGLVTDMFDFDIFVMAAFGEATLK